MEEHPSVQTEIDSALEVASNQAANAPEVDIVANAQRLNGIGTGLQVAFDKGPQTLYGGPLPEPSYGGPLPEALHENVIIQPLGETDRDSTKISGLRKKLLISLAVVTLVVLMTIALAVGIKFGDVNKSPKASLAPPPVPPVVSASPVLLNNTSIASCILSNGDRHLFFQDYNNTIRHAIRLASSNQWITKLPRPIVDADADEAKSHSPLTIHADGADIMRIFYVDRNNTLSSVNLYGKWNNEKVQPLTRVHQDLRQLSTMYYHPQSDPTVQLLSLFYKNPDGEVSGLYRYLFTNDTRWNDMGDIFPTGVSGPDKYTPFNAQSANYYREVPQFCRTEPSPTVRHSVCFAILCLDAVPGTRPSDCSWGSSEFQEIPNCKACLGEDSDLVYMDRGTTRFDARLGWVDDGKLIVTSLESSSKPRIQKRDIPVLLTPFPFSRLASSPFFGFTYLYLYHQFDGFTITEHEFNANISAWTSSINITISV